ncbi:hypothetical protein [Christiangramia sp. SM2212]|uniref:Uncharacterized protein n=1 Tax=Christiangramia sediminicola TaxID=3073267 RepID=A0ABU1EQY9_9FLAO|nr:hypothetical protein [Christiangramia sp. SM2212]MDR5590805.1 hypothetical protein [Christiangramia sp. SM2212]
MIDFFKVKIHNKAQFEQLIEENKFSYQAVYSSSKDQVIEYPKVYKKDNLEIKITQNHGYLKGSLHKFYNIIHNYNEQNYNHLLYSDLEELIPALEEEYFLRENNNVIQLEVGFNLLTDTDPSEIIRDQIFLHRYEDPDRNKNYGGRGRLKTFKTSQVELKIYDKGRQSNLVNSILRIELKFLRTRKLNSINIFQLNDLLKVDNLDNLFAELIKEYSKLIIIDKNWEKRINSDDDLSVIKQAISSHFWRGFSQKNTWKKKKARMKKVNSILSKYNLDSTKERLLDNIYAQYIGFQERFSEFQNLEIKYSKPKKRE